MGTKIVHGPRKPVHKSRKFLSVVICTLLPWISWITVKMPVEYVVTAMIPWILWAGGEWSMDWIQVCFKSFHSAKAAADNEVAKNEGEDPSFDDSDGA